MEDVYSFGSWLKQRRRALDLTQAEFAQRVGCATVTLQKIELDDRRPSKAIAARLAQVLGIPSEHHDAFVKSARGERPLDRLAAFEAIDPPTERSRPYPAHNLPTPSTPLVGRERELADIMHALRDASVRLVTLTGPGGTGKTRLATEAASHLLHDTPQDVPDGVWLVELAHIGDPTLVPAAVAQVLGIKESREQSLIAAVKAHLRDKRLVLVLDNFEHLTATAPFVSDLLAATTHVTVLVTSQSLLHLSGEHHFPVPPLEHPDLAQLPPLKALEGYAAVRLFVQRARAVRPTFSLTAANAAAVASICARLDGIPLALELAAARVRIFQPSALLARLDQRFATLTDGAVDRPVRQQSLRNMIDWSYGLLDPAEQGTFARLAVFAGGCTLEAAEAVVGGGDDPPADVTDVLVSLVDKSLVRQQDGPNDEPRFTMLESIRAYALERLEESDEAASVRERHARYFLGWVEAMASRNRKQQNITELQDEGEIGNLAAALTWTAQAGDLDVGMRWLAVGLWFGPVGWLGQLSTAWPRWYQALLNAPPTMPVRERATALHDVGVMAMNDRAFPQAIALLEEALTLWRTLNDPDAVFRALSNLGDAYRDHGIYAQAMPRYEEALALALAHGNQFFVGATYHVMGELALLQGDYERALALERASIPYYRTAGQTWGIGLALLNASFVAIHQGDDALATQYLHETLAIVGVQEQTRMLLGCLVGFAALAAPRQPERTARLLGALEALGGSDMVWVVVQRQHAWATTTAQSALDSGAWDAAWAEGRAMTLEQTLASVQEAAPPD